MFLPIAATTEAMFLVPYVPVCLFLAQLLIKCIIPLLWGRYSYKQLWLYRYRPDGTQLHVYLFLRVVL